jgi:hypothetical protein
VSIPTSATLFSYAATRALRVALVLVALAAAAVTADARSRPLGPGPFDRVSIGNNALTITVRQNGSTVPFTGSVSLRASNGAELAGFSSAPRIQSAGSRLSQGGSVNGRPLAEFFPDGGLSFVEIKNGDGGTTHLVLRRDGNRLDVERADRGEARVSQVQSQDFAGISVLADSEVTVRLSKQNRLSKVRKAVIALTLPDALPDSSQLFVTGRATSQSGNTGVVPYTPIRPGDRFAFVTFDVVPDDYSIEFTFGVTLRPSSSLDQRLTVTHRLPDVVTVTKGAFVLAAIPDPPSLRETPVTVDGLDQIVGLAGQARHTSMTLSHTTASLSCTVAADLTFAARFEATLLLPEGEYETSLLVDLADVGPSNAGTACNFGLGHVVAGAVAPLEIPPVVRLTGTALDPTIVLAPSPGPNNSLPRHNVFVRPADAGSSYFGIARLSGFQRGFKSFAPRGMRASLQATFQIRLGDTPPDEGTPENATGSLLVTSGTQPTPLESDTVIDLTVPALPRYVTLRGTVVRADGSPARGAYIQAYSGSIAGSSSGFNAIVTTNRDGEFRLRVLPSDKYGLYVFDFGE